MIQPKECDMPTSPLYDSTRAALRQRLPASLDSQLDTLGLLIVAAVQSMSSQVAKIARAMPLETTQRSKQQRLRRFLDNERITQTDHYQPIIKQALHGLKGQRVQLLIDRVLLRDRHNILVVSVGFRRRSIPLCWKALAHRGSSNLEERKELLQAAVKLLPTGVRISVHGDSEFRTTALFAWLRSQGYDVMLGVVGHSLVYTTDDPAADGQLLVERLGTARGVVYLSAVYLTEARYGPLNVLAWWEHDAEGKRVLRGAMTNLAATPRTKALGKRRMWIETVFRDWQSGGFHLDQCGMEDRERVARLLIVLAIGYLWLVSLGRWVVKKGYRKLIDDGSRRNWHFSLFQLGVGWMERLHSFTLPLPLLLYLYT
jgi:hypothetical protein